VFLAVNLITDTNNMEVILMKRHVFLFTLLSLCLVGVMILSGCGDGDDDNGTTPSVLYDVSGTWNVGSVGLGNLVLILAQDASGNITGTALRGGDGGTVTSGSNTNNSITITILFVDQMTLILTGTVRDADNMDGTYQSYYDPNAVDTDVWSATRGS
jgi:hypothetical protein